jgi:hypothetical protein
MPVTHDDHGISFTPVSDLVSADAIMALGFDRLDRPMDSAQLLALSQTTWQVMDDRPGTEALIANENRRRRESAERFITALVATEGGFRLYLYGADSGARSLIWDARGIAALVPLYVPHTLTGETLGLMAYSSAVPEWPLRQGDRLVREVSPERAYSVAAEDLQACEVDQPNVFVKITERFASKAEAIEYEAREACRRQDPDVSEATAAFIEALGDARRFAPRPVRSMASTALQRMYAVTLAAYARRQFEQNPVWQNRSTDEAFESLHVHRHFNQRGETITADEWMEQMGTTSITNNTFGRGFAVAGTTNHDEEIRLTTAMIWIGLDFTIFDQRTEMGALMFGSVLRADKGGETKETTNASHFWHCASSVEAEAMWRAFTAELANENEPMMLEFRETFAPTVAMLFEQKQPYALHQLVDAFGAAVVAAAIAQRKQGAA